MGRKQGPRKGSMQIWPRKRAEKFLPRVNWTPVTTLNSAQKTNMLGFLGYKVGMMSAYVKDNTPDSMTKNKRVIIPVTVIECPTMKILSVRFYKNNKVVKDILNDNLDKELKRIIRLPKNKISSKEIIEKMKAEDFDDITLVAYSQPKKIELKKTPDITEIGLGGNNADRLEFVKASLAKEISIADVFSKGVVDVRGLTKGKGFQGAVKRFGIRLRSHKAEKGQRVVGSVGAWHPIGIKFRVPRAGQLGMFTRITYNNPIVAIKKYSEGDSLAKHAFDHYGIVKGDYIVIAGSVQGPCKRQLIISAPLRPTKKQTKRNYELVELR